VTRLESVLAQIDTDFPDHLELAKSFVRQPSISADGTGIDEMAAKVAGEIERLGGVAEVVPTPGHPVVLGNIDVGAAKTLLVYGMYDVQPVAGEEWLVPPFEGEVIDLPGFGDCVVSRGIMNSKGPLAGTLSALQSFRASGNELPMNIKFVVEGEEELGSRNLPQFVADNVGRLAADAAFFPFYSQDPTGKILMYLGAKGMVFFELTVRGGEWGAPRSNGVHGAYSAWLHNPAWILTQALATMLSRDQTRVLVDGIYDDVDPPSAEDEEHLEALGRSFDPSVPLASVDAARFKFEGSPGEIMRRYLFEPSLNIDGLVAGHFEEGMKTLLPHEATAKIDFRLIPRMEPENVVEALRAHLDKHGFPEIEIKQHGSYPWSKSSITSPANAALYGAYIDSGYETDVWPLLPGSAPFYLFTRELGIDVAIGGLGHGGGQHSPNEYATVEGMKLFEKSVVMFVEHLAERWRDAS
jgi:acetylornithine deacetylase/succinyl-diaminopimelate desuccinylase-like protein